MQNKQLAKRTSNTALARQSTLKKVGGSIMATIPPHLLRELRLAAGSRISVAKSDGRLIITPEVPKKANKRIGLTARLAMCDFSVPLSPARKAEDEAWLNDGRVGREEI